MILTMTHQGSSHGVPSSFQQSPLAFTSSRSNVNAKGRRSSSAMNELIAQAKAATGMNRIHLALEIMRSPDAPPLTAIGLDSDAPDSIIQLLRDPDLSVQDRASVIVAAHALCNHRVFQAKFLAADGLSALCQVISSALTEGENGDEDENNTETDDAEHPDRVPLRPDVFNINSCTPSKRSNNQTTLTQSSDSDSAQSVTPLVEPKDTSVIPGDQTPPTTRPSSSVRRVLTASAPGGTHRIVWNAAIRTIAKLMVVSHAACSRSIDTGSLALLAKAAVPGEPMDIRLRAAAGLAAIAAWSGPRRALDIVQTEDVIYSMTSIVAEQDERIPNDLRTATIDGLVVMSFRRHARGILQKYGCDEKIKAAARLATVSGDYTTAARSTVAAGHLTGRSIDEYGFMVEENDKNTFNDANDGAESAPETLVEASTSDSPESSKQLVRRGTGLQHLHQQLLEEPYIEVEDLNVLEEIVHEDAGVLSSSPRDRNYVRHAARAYGVSADEIEYISLLEDDPSPTKQDTQNREKNAITEKDGQRPTEQSAVPANEFSSFPADHVRTDLDEIRPGRVASSLKSSVDGRGMRTPKRSNMSGDIFTASPNRTSESSPRLSSNLHQMQDPDFDRALVNDDEDDVCTSTTGASSKSKITSPLLMFSSAARKAAEKDQNRSQLLRKTNSQLSRETEHERKWKGILEKRGDLLKRERGKSSRVAGYRELAPIPIPSSLRRRLWPLLLDTAALREHKPGLYGRLCKEGSKRSLSDDIEHTIDADVTRTMPLHSLFWAGGAQVGVQSLRSILRAYAFYVPDVGYCQGMSSIAAVLLMNAEDEEEAFLMMVQFMNRFQYKKVFAQGFPLMLHWLAELKPLVVHYMPDLAKHMERENVTLELYADKWLITALSHNFPHRHLLRVWDLMFLGGSPKIVLKACLMVLKCCESRLMAMDFEGMLSLLQREFAKPEVGVLDVKDPEPFISAMREYRFMNDIKKSEVAITAAKPSNTGTAKTDHKTAEVSKKKSGMRKRDKVACCFGCFRSPTKED